MYNIMLAESNTCQKIGVLLIMSKHDFNTILVAYDKHNLNFVLLASDRTSLTRLIIHEQSCKTC